MKFGYTLLFVSDVEQTIGFYESAFGLKRKFIHENQYGELDTGATKLGFVSYDLASSSGVEYLETQMNGPSPPFEVALVSDDVSAAYERAVEAAAAAIAPPKEKPWGQTVAYVRDLNGFLVELCSPVPQ